MPYLTREIKIPDYNWTVKVYDPSLGELDTLEKAYKSGDVQKVGEAWVPLLAGWDCTDRSESKLLVSPTTVASLPAIVLRQMMKSLQDTIFKKDDDSKNTSAS